MKRNIIVAKDAISPALCNTIIKLAQNSFRPAEIGGPIEGGVQGHRDATQRRSETSWLNGSIRYLDVFIPILQIIKNINDQFYGFDLMEPEAFQITKYDEKNQGFYRPHMDGVYDPVPPEGLVRKLSLSIQLTPPEYYEGGEFEFMSIDTTSQTGAAFQPSFFNTKGHGLFFPSHVFHRVKPVTRGTRRSLVCWFTGPRP
jgi:PKHD-type hydroxylase